MMGRMQLHNTHHSPAAAAAASHNDIDDLANMFGKQMKVGRRYHPYKRPTKRSTRSVSKMNVNKTVQKLKNASKKSTRATKMAVDAINKAHRAASIASSPQRVTRSMVRSGKGSLVKGLQNVTRKSVRATKMAVDAANQAQNAASLAAEAAAQAAASINGNAVFPGLRQHSNELFAAYPTMTKTRSRKAGLKHGYRYNYHY